MPIKPIMSKLEAQIDLAIRALPTSKPKHYIVRPARPKHAGGKARHGSGLHTLTLKKTGSEPWYIWRGELPGFGLRIIIQRVDFSDLGYAWEIAANGQRIAHGTTYFHAALEAINGVMERNGYRWRVTAKPLRAGGKARSPRLGGGGRFAALKAKIAARGGVRDPGAVAAAIGRKKYGPRKFQKLAVKGRKRGGKARHGYPEETMYYQRHGHGFEAWSYSDGDRVWLMRDKSEAEVRAYAERHGYRLVSVK